MHSEGKRSTGLMANTRMIIDLMRVTPWSRWITLVVLAIAVGIAELVGTLLIFALLATLTSSAVPDGIPLIGGLRKQVSGLSDDGFLILLAILVAGFFTIRAGILLGQSYLQNRIGHNSGVRLANRLVGGYLRIPYRLYVERNSAEFIRNTFQSVITIVLSAFIPMVLLISEGVLLIGIITALFLASPLATLYSALALSPIVFLLLRLMRHRTQRLGDAQQSAGLSTLKWLHETFGNLRDIRILGRESFFEERFDRKRSEMARVLYLRGLLTDVPRVTIETILVLFISGFLLVTIVSGQNVAQGFAVLGTFAYAGIRLLPSLSRIITGLNNLRFAESAVGEIHAELELIEGWVKEWEPEGDRVELREAIEVRDVTFRFAEGPAVLGGVSFTIPKGSRVGIVGTTGSGKSTLLDLITGLLEPTSGSVLVDGVPVYQIRRSWHRSLGVVPQASVLIDDTIRQNIALGLRDDEIDEIRLREAVVAAQLDPFLSELNQGLETIVGERGIRLSGGQRQRIAIARALYRRPDVLIFDEATSALDNVTETALIGAIDDLGEGRTVLMVAHRISSLSHCDRVFVLEQGRIVDSGSFDELSTRSPLFREAQS